MASKEKAASPGRGETALNKTLKPNFNASIPRMQGRVGNPIDSFLSLLEGIKRTGNETWLAKCPAHPDKSPSLSLRDTDEKILIHCHAGCSVHEVVAAVGLELSDLFPPRPADPAYISKPERRPFPAADILRAIGFEALVVGCAASAMATGKVLAAVDHDRLLVAVRRIQSALDAGGLNNG